MTIATAANERATVSVQEIRPGLIALHHHTPTIERTDYDTLFAEAARKLGYRHDRRFKIAWRKI
jgi:hypothetical protein